MDGSGMLAIIWKCSHTPYSKARSGQQSITHGVTRLSLYNICFWFFRTTQPPRLGYQECT